jgi:hypothetical protein
MSPGKYQLLPKMLNTLRSVETDKASQGAALKFCIGGQICTPNACRHSLLILQVGGFR